jgi:LacI family transcriptional regulator
VLSSKKRPTIDDVAAYSGVAKVTVSRVLNGGPNVRPEVREKVRRAVAALDYRVNAQARFLATGVSRQLTIVHESALDAEPNSYYHSALELGALRGCADRGFVLSTLALDARSPDYAGRLIETIKSGRTDGLILTPPFSDDVALVQAIIEARCPVVCVAGSAGVRTVTASIGIDDEAAGNAIARFLIGLGHRRFGYIDGPEGHVSATYRFKGLMRAMEDAGVASHVFTERGDFTFRSGIVLADKLFSEHSEITVLVCANDDMAAGATLTAHRRGLAIPADISISGFDDTPVSEIIWPPLTTVHQPIRRMGQRAVEVLVDAIQSGNGVTDAAFEGIPFEVIERASTGPPRA